MAAAIHRRRTSGLSANGGARHGDLPEQGHWPPHGSQARRSSYAPRFRAPPAPRTKQRPPLARTRQERNGTDDRPRMRQRQRPFTSQGSLRPRAGIVDSRADSALSPASNSRPATSPRVCIPRYKVPAAAPSGRRLGQSTAATKANPPSPRRRGRLEPDRARPASSGCDRAPHAPGGRLRSSLKVPEHVHPPPPR